VTTEYHDVNENNRRSRDRREGDSVRIEWLKRNSDELREFRIKLDDVVRNQDTAKRQHEIMLERLDIVSEAIGIDTRGHHIKGGIAETFAKLSGIKLALVWAAGGVIAVMGLYSTVKEIGQRWLGH
jgi:hypothetical protein